MSVKKLMEEREEVDKHIEDGTGYLHIDFTKEGDSILSKVDAVISGDMISAALILMIEKAAEETNQDPIEFLSELAVNMMLKNRKDDEEDDDD